MTVLHPDYPIVEGWQTISPPWRLMLPEQFNRRTEGGELIFWRPGFTTYIAHWQNDRGLKPRDLCDEIRRTSSPKAFDQQQVDDGGLVRYSYRLRENAEQGKVPSFYAFVIHDLSQVEAAFYFDSEDDLGVAWRVWLSISPWTATNPGSIESM
jgi:hypothetical protein